MIVLVITRTLTLTRAPIPTPPLWARFANTHLVHVLSIDVLIGGHVQVQTFQLGSILRKEYFDESSPNYIRNVRTDLVNLDQVHARIKNGGEGRVVFDSTISLLQGLFPPTPSNTIVLANDTTIIAPLGGYQYVPGECYTYNMYRVVSLTSLQLRLSSLPMIARLRAGRIAQYSQLLLCRTTSDMNPPDVRGTCENVLRFTCFQDCGAAGPAVLQGRS